MNCHLTIIWFLDLDLAVGQAIPFICTDMLWKGHVTSLIFLLFGPILLGWSINIGQKSNIFFIYVLFIFIFKQHMLKRDPVFKMKSVIKYYLFFFYFFFINNTSHMLKRDPVFKMKSAVLLQDLLF